MLTEIQISERLRFAYRPGRITARDDPSTPREDRPLTCAAVLLPLARLENRWQLVFTRRTEAVEHHKGQVSFPGGACNNDEKTPEETALREAEEEIGLLPRDVHLLGRLNDYVTITGYRVTPVVGVMPWPYACRPAPGEVARVFTIPLDWLADRRNWEEKPSTPDGRARPFPVVIYREYEGEVLWGASARMTLNFLQVMGIL